MKRDLQRRRLLAGLLLLGLMGSAAEAATFTVHNLNDKDDGSLRKAISDAELNSEEHTIVFDVSGTIVLDTTLPTITKADGLTIDGTGQTVTISGNHAVQVIQVGVGAQLTLEHLTVANAKSFAGGGIRNDGILTVTNSTFSGNSANGGGGGGGIFNFQGTVIVTNSTFSGNQATFGGGIYNYFGTISVTNSTFSGNQATTGGGISNIVSSTLNLTNTILANSPQGSDCVNNGTINASGINLIEDGSCSVPNALSGDPLLGPLKNNGGPTETMALLPESQALDAVNVGTCPPPATDQRGVSRPQGPYCDIGAFEALIVGCTTTANLRSGGSGDTLRITNQASFGMLIKLQFVNAQGAVQGQTVAKSLAPGQSSSATVSALLQQARIGVFNSAWLLQVQTEPKAGVTETPLQSVYLPNNGTPAVPMIYTCSPEGSAN